MCDDAIYGPYIEKNHIIVKLELATRVILTRLYVSVTFNKKIKENGTQHDVPQTIDRSHVKKRKTSIQITHAIKMRIFTDNVNRRWTAKVNCIKDAKYIQSTNYNVKIIGR